MTDYEHKIKKDIEKLITSELHISVKLCNRPPSKRIKEYALKRIVECRDMLAWIARTR